MVLGHTNRATVHWCSSALHVVLTEANIQSMCLEQRGRNQGACSHCRDLILNGQEIRTAGPGFGG